MLRAHLSAPIKKNRHPKSGLEISYNSTTRAFSMHRQPLRSLHRMLDAFFPFDRHQIARKLAAADARTAGEEDEDAMMRSTTSLADQQYKQKQQQKRLLDNDENARVQKIFAEWKQSGRLARNVAAFFQARMLERPLPPILEAHGDEPAFAAATSGAAEAVLKRFSVAEHDFVIGSKDRNVAGKADFVLRDRSSPRRLCLLSFRATASRLPQMFFLSAPQFFSESNLAASPLEHLANERLARSAVEVALLGSLFQSEDYSRFFVNQYGGGRRMTDENINDDNDEENVSPPSSVTLQHLVIHVGRRSDLSVGWSEMEVEPAGVLLPPDATGEVSVDQMVNEILT